jgi:hypothetical protein
MSRNVHAGTWIVAALCAGTSADAAPSLRGANVRVTFESPRACTVSMSLTVDGATEIEHRIESMGAIDAPAVSEPGAGLEMISIDGARQAGPLRVVGVTRSLLLYADRSAYELAYRAQQPESRAYRCPLSLPVAPADGRSGAVRLSVTIPPGAVPGRSMPRIDWTGSRGSATLAHLPAFVRVPFVETGAAPGWDVGWLVDLLAIAIFAGATAVWLALRRR